MALHNVPESDSFDTNVQMPSDGDAADASDLETSTVRPLVNRTRWLSNRFSPFLLGGTVEPASHLVFDLSSGKLEVVGDGDYGLEIGSGAQLLPHGRIGDYCFDGEGSYGRPNRRVRIASLGSNTTIDPALHDTFMLTPVDANRVVEIDTPIISPQRGDWCVVVNLSGTYTLQVNAPGGSGLFSLAAEDTNVRHWVEIVYNGTAWVALRWGSGA